LAIPGCLFYDANILFDLLAGRVGGDAIASKSSRYQNARRVHTTAQKTGIARFASSITYELLDQRIREVTNLTGSIIKSLTNAIRDTKLDKSSGKLGRFDVATDLFIVEEHIGEKFKTIPQNNEWAKDAIRVLERFIVEIVEDEFGKHGQSVKTEDVLATLIIALRQFGDLSDRRKTELAQLKLEVPQVDMSIDPPTLSMLRNKVKMTDEEDLAQLAAAVQQQKSQNRWTIVVSTDYRHIIGAKTQLFESMRLMCSSPLYAASHLRDLNKNIGPMPYPDKMSYVA
jgi:hypothetical protein